MAEKKKPVETLEEQIIASRAEYRDLIRTGLDEQIKTISERLAGGNRDGEEIVTIKALAAALDYVFEQPVPAPSVHAAEVLSPAMIFVSPVCPKCGVTDTAIMLNVSSVLTVDSDGSEIKLKGKSKARTHICGQMTLLEGDGQTTINDILGD